jgi:hypothetical protein
VEVDAGAGYSGTPLSRKLGLEPGARVVLLQAPPGFEALLAPLPPGVVIRRDLRRGRPVDLVVLFVTARARLESGIGRVLESLPPDGACWVAWPKRASKVPTDMSDHVVRDVVLPLGWVDTKVCAVDATWSALRLVMRRELRGRHRAPPDRRVEPP